MRISRAAAWAVGLLVVAALPLAWCAIFPTPRFPAPTGPYAVGTRIYDAWTDPARAEPFTEDPADQRQLVVQIWYPTNGSGPRARYIEHDATIAALAAQFRVPAFLLRNIRNARTHSMLNAPVASGSFPVLLNPTGLSGFRDASLFWIEELASHGYVVVGIDQPGAAAATVLPGGRVIPLLQPAEFKRYMPLALSQSPRQAPQMNGVVLPGGIVPFLARDLLFVLDRLEALSREDPALAGHLDMERVGVFGVSLGGYLGPQACHLDQRFRACLVADAGQSAAVARDGLQQPLMIMSRDAAVIRQERAKAGGWPEPEIEHTLRDERALFEHNRGDAYYITMNGMYHVNWTDAPILTPLIGWMGLAGPIDPYRGFAQTNAYTRAFFDRYLKDRPSPLLDEASPASVDVRLEKRLVEQQ